MGAILATVPILTETNIPLSALAGFPYNVVNKSVIQAQGLVHIKSSTRPECTQLSSLNYLLPILTL